ncbi:zona pellucida-like domain-containing protein 1 [Scyliorhinus canicula]|uniref:zona pellucida-like domain-containing protein 1 n=1 Tax=Scyliorhinus canicula TaxID=7830 RepID=UPI0018F3C756|nr:zona pellucida-like domain-containing protein 1 [Scyliorhinus canicula]
MSFLLLLLLLGLAASTPVQQPLQNCRGNPTHRAAKSSDLVVVCGQRSVTLSILLCPVYYSGYNEMMLAMNSVFTDPDCYGEVHWNLSIPVLHFHFPITDNIIGKCGNAFQVLDEDNEGIFQETSRVQTMSVRGAILSQESADSMVTYTQGLLYQYSCNYPLLYLVNNTKISVDGLSVAMRDNQGRFISTLGLELYSHSYQSRLLIPHYGIPLNTTIFVAVMAFNLSSRFHLFLERCYASTSKILGNGSTYDLFDGFQRNGEKISNFITDLRLIAQGCNYADLTDSIIRDQLTYGLSNEHFRESFMHQNDHTLKNHHSKVHSCKSTAKYHSPTQKHANFKVRIVDTMEIQTPKENFSDQEFFHSWENTYFFGIIDSAEELQAPTTNPQYVNAINPLCT